MKTFATVIVLSDGLQPHRYQDYTVPFETLSEFHQRLEILLLDHARNSGPVKTFQVFFK